MRITAVLSGKVELADIDTKPYNITSRQAPSRRPSKENRDTVAGALGRPGATAISG